MDWAETERLTDMAHGREELAEALGDLAATCRDAEEGYNKAAKGVHSDELRSTLDKLSVEREQFARELDEHAATFGRQPGQTGHGGGVLRQGWVDLEQRIRPKDDAEILENCVAGEQGSLNHYARALALPFDEEVLAVLRRQEAAIRHSVDQLRSVTVRSHS
jgi:uncharacterized protein (TIGR02284 family)